MFLCAAAATASYRSDGSYTTIEFTVDNATTTLKPVLLAFVKLSRCDEVSACEFLCRHLSFTVVTEASSATKFSLCLLLQTKKFLFSIKYTLFYK